MSPPALDPVAPPRELDLIGLKCPLPALKLGRALEAALPGAQILALCSDPLAEIDIPHLLAQTGDMLVSREREGDVLRFLVRKAG